QLRKWFESNAPGSRHHGFPVLSERGHLLGVVTRHEIMDATNKKTGASGDAEPRVEELLKRGAAVVFEDSSLREAADLMVSFSVGRLPVVSRAAHNRVIGILTRSDLLAAHARRLNENDPTQPRLRIPFVRIVRV
ncbi:MAG TPA: CBS domain-containing protein, partial [Polyangiaceae bacterium]|nr:CBS domain-containing protein [Polyangiaceae bacterium]